MAWRCRMPTGYTEWSSTTFCAKKPLSEQETHRMISHRGWAFLWCEGQEAAKGGQHVAAFLHLQQFLQRPHGVDSSLFIPHARHKGVSQINLMHCGQQQWHRFS